MPRKLPILKTEEVARILFKLGFQPKRKKGSHLILTRNKKIVVVPVHEGRDLPKGTLMSILKQSGITKQELEKYI